MTENALPEMENIVPELSHITFDGTIANSMVYSVKVTYPGEETRRVQFLGSVPGNGPVLLISGDMQVFIDDPSRFGPFGPEFIRRFYGQGRKGTK